MEPTEKVINYFSKNESRLGYRLVTFGAKHFGYYPTGKANISEKEAQENIHHLLIEKIHVSTGQKVLDAGCGEGVVAVAVAQKTGALVEGITIVPFEFARAAKLAIANKVDDKTHFQIMDYTQLDFPEGFFDAVYTVETLVHAYDLEKTLKGFYRVLKPGGRLVNFEYSFSPEESAERKKYPRATKVFDWVAEESAMQSYRKMSHGQFAELLRQTGFTGVKEDNLTSNIQPSLDRLHRLARWPYAIIHLLHLENLFVNTTAAAVLFPLIKNTDLFRYNLYTCQKPQSLF